MSTRPHARRPFLLLLAGSVALTAATRPAALDAAASLVPWTDLTDADALTSALVRKTVVDGRTVYFPTPTKELAAELEARAAATGETALAALRHLAEARRELGDLPGAEEALSRWAGGSGGAAWAEASRWGATYRRWPFAFAAARSALEGGAPEPVRKSLATERIAWADGDPSLADPLALRAERAALFPSEAAFVTEWIRALEKAGKLPQAEEALRGARGLPEETRLLVLSDLKGDHGDPAGAFSVLEAFVADPAKTPASRTLAAFARRADAVAASRMESMRLDLEKTFDARSVTLLARWFEGKGRSDLALELLTQVELRHEARFTRAGRLAMTRLFEALDALPEAFRSRLAGAAAGTEGERLDDLADLARLALSAGARPIAWGTLNDEGYRWAARTDVTPGFTTAGLSFLLTGFGREDALGELEAQRLPEKTLRAGRLLLAELERRAPGHAALPRLHVKVMERLVQAGKGDEALGLLARAERGDEATRAEARRVALLAMRQTKAPLERERTLWAERLALLAPDGSVPGSGEEAADEAGDPEAPGFGADEGEGSEGGEEGEAPSRLKGETRTDDYDRVLNEAIIRLDDRDRSHRASLSLLLGEMDRLPRAEAVWLKAVDRISSWKLDDDLEPRYRKAITAFEGPEWWKKLARWYARRQRTAELKALGEEIAASFRGSALFARDPMLQGAVVALEEQPNPYVLFSDFLALRALQRFPASPAVLERAESRLLGRTAFDALKMERPRDVKDRAVVDDALLALRRDAVLFADAPRRGRLLDGLMRNGALEAFLRRLEEAAAKTPVENVLLLDGWTRLSRFERAVPFAEALAGAYPGGGDRAGEAISLERSLSAFSPERAAAAERIAARAAAAAADPSPFWMPIGEMWQDLERPIPAGEAFRKVLAASPRNPETILDVATAFWDYGRFAEALQVLADGRTRLGRSGLHAFEAGVLREELRDRDGAITEYVSALAEDGDGGWRSRQRLARLAGRPAVRDLLVGRIAKLVPGRPEDETALVAHLPLVGLGSAETTGWDDWMDLPNDPVARAERASRRDETRPAERQGTAAVGEAAWKKALEMAPRATTATFLSSLRGWSASLADARWAGADAATALESLLLAREAELLPAEEARIPKEAARAAWLLDRGRTGEAKAAFTKLLPRVNALPDGATKIRTLAAHARFLEATGGEAAGAFREAARRFPWSLGLLEDQVEYLFRAGGDAEGLDILEAAAQRAAEGHRERLTERLVNESLSRKDLARARRGVERLLSFTLEPRARVSALALSARLAWREETPIDPIALAKAESAKLPEEARPDLWAALAGAAREEGRLEAGVDLYIEALNRRTSREWLREACRLAVRARKADALLDFFRQQRARSPRDVRWAVAVREILTFQGDLAGAVAAAREAVAVAPEREDLTRETVELLERQGRFREAADFLDGWARTRLADEGVASWRASLYVRAGDVRKALAVDRAAIAAVLSTGATDATDEAARRTARAARRYLRLGRANAAWELAAPGGDPARVAEVPLANAERAEIALRAGTFPLLFARFASDEEFLQETGWAFSRIALPEQREALEKEILGRIFRPDGSVDDAAVARLHPYTESAGLTRFDEALSRRLLTAVPPAKAFWGADPPEAFVAGLRPAEWAAGKDGSSRLRLVRSDFHSDWVRYLAAREDDAGLRPALAPLVADLNAKLLGIAPVTRAVPYASWFPVEAFARLAARPENADWKNGVDGWFRTTGAFRRFLAATGSSWSVKPLVPLLSPETRRAFFLRGAPPPPRGVTESPRLLARSAAVDRVADALAALVTGSPGAATNADVVRLRGPRSVGDVLSADPGFAWAQLAPLPGDHGDDLVTGSGVDAGRAPARLWGLRPSAPWFVLESLARLYERSPEAPFVPLEAASRGGESARALAAVRSAEALSGLPLALALDEAWFTDLAQTDRISRRLRLLVATGGDGGKERANALLRSEVRARQPKASEALFRAWERSASPLGLAHPLSHLAPEQPVASGLLAFLCDREGPAAVVALRPADEAEYRGALGARWGGRLEALSPEKLDLYLREVWVHDAGGFPVAAAARLPALRDAAPVLARLAPPLRAEGLAAVRALPDTARLAEIARRAGDLGTGLDLLFLSADVARGDEAAALARLGKLMGRPGGLVSPLTLAEPDLAPPVEGGETPAPAREEGSPVLRAFRVVRDAKRPELLAKATALLLPHVETRIAASAAPADLWEIAFELKPASERPALLAELERSWARGEWSGREEIAALVAVLARKERAAGLRWFTRLPEPAFFAEARERAVLLSALKDVDGARGEWVAARARMGLTQDQEVAAFDAWRQLGGDSAAGAPAWWTTARGFWQRKGAEFVTWGGDLARHLAAHPYDRHSARVVFRSLAPAPERFVAPSALASGGTGDSVARWRVARAELSRSPAAARAALRSTWFDPDELRQRRFPAAEAEGLLADLARIGAASREESLVERALSALEDRRAASLPALGAEIAALRRQAAPRPETLLGDGTTVTRLLPKDLTWDLYARVLNAEDVP